MKSDTRCPEYRTLYQGYKGSGGKIYCADCYKKRFGNWPWQ